MSDNIQVVANKVKDVIYAATVVTGHLPAVTGDTPGPRPNVLIGIPEDELYLLHTTVGFLKDAD